MIVIRTSLQKEGKTHLPGAHKLPTPAPPTQTFPWERGRGWNMGGELIITNATVCPAHLSTASRPTDKGAHFTLQTITNNNKTSDIK